MKNTSDLRSFLIRQMEGVVKGDVSLETAKGISNLSQQIYNTLNIEIKMAQAKEKIGDSINPVDFK